MSFFFTLHVDAYDQGTGLSRRIRFVHAERSAFKQLPATILRCIAQNLGCKSLANLCLSCKQLNAIAHPLLYENVVIESPFGILALLDRLNHDTELGDRIKTLKLGAVRLLTSVSQRTWYTESLDRGLWLFAGGDPDRRQQLEHLLRRDNSPGSFIRDHNIVGCFSFMILCRTPNLVSLEVAVQLDGYNETNRMLFLAISDILPRRPFLSTLRSLVLVTCENSNTFTKSLFDPSILANFFGFPKLTNLTLRNDAGDWSTMPQTPNLYALYNKYFPYNVTSLNLAWSPRLTTSIIDIAVTFPSLETLRITGTCNPDTWDTSSETANQGHEIPDEPDGPSLLHKNLSNGLAQLRCLTKLDIDLHRHGGLSYSKLLGPDGVLDLTMLSRLQSLRIPFDFFVQSHSTTGCLHHIACPDDVLPRSLKHVTLQLGCLWCISNLSSLYDIERQVSRVEESPWQSREAALQFLEELPRLGKETFPHLESVDYCWRPDPLDACHCGETARRHRADCVYDLSIRALSPQIGYRTGFDKDGASSNFKDRFTELSVSFFNMGVRFKTVQDKFDLIPF